MHGDECMDMNGKLFMLSQEFYFSTRDINTKLIYFISYTTRSDKHMLDYENTILTLRNPVLVMKVQSTADDNEGGVTRAEVCGSSTWKALSNPLEIAFIHFQLHCTPSKEYRTHWAHKRRLKRGPSYINSLSNSLWLRLRMTSQPITLCIMCHGIFAQMYVKW